MSHQWATARTGEDKQGLPDLTLQPGAWKVPELYVLEGRGMVQLEENTKIALSEP